MANAVWAQIAGESGIALDAERVARLDRYLQLLREGNDRFNLTRIVEPGEAEIGHVADALTLLPFLSRQDFDLADIGSGGGVPGIPLAIVLPAARVLLIEATKKKAEFLRACAAELGLSNVTVIDDRAEAAGRGSTRDSVDIVASRAVATLDWLIEWSLPLLRIGGSMLAMKGPKVVEELPAASLVSLRLGGGTPMLHEVRTPGLEHHRIIEMKKLAATPDGFPRDPTIAKGRPLV